MKTEYGTGEVILLQALDYFRKKTEYLEDAVINHGELNEVYEALHGDYIEEKKKNAALNKSYDELFNDATELQNELNEAKAKLEIQEERERLLRANHDALREENIKLRNDYNRYVSYTDEYEEEIRRIKESNGKLNVRVNQLEGELDELSANLLTYKKLYEEEKAKVADLEERYQNLLTIHEADKPKNDLPSDFLDWLAE